MRVRQKEYLLEKCISTEEQLKEVVKTNNRVHEMGGSTMQNNY